MRLSGSSKVVMAAGSQGLLFPAHSRLSFAATSAVFRATGKNILWATELLLFYGISFSPSQADQFVFPTPPSHPFPQPNSLSPPPNISTAILQANIS